ncbi:heme exporter protein CcmD [Frigidibacter sp. ROC022]|uniref:heme exporter protein CcmD n=1 Tax=Frigidibacter sp. ROC022 TaxID=2971796 RepID=UPI00215B0FFA|nr:heme exporter protein CcmD [Frigidibacter sp. ROC022]MCR8726416.1 heme exporter protein CcmD [Frigidibacter sp. ROC022]
MPDLGKYAFTVLSAYGATLLLLGGLVLVTWVRARSVRQRLAEAERRREAGNG